MGKRGSKGTEVVVLAVVLPGLGQGEVCQIHVSLSLFITTILFDTRSFRSEMHWSYVKYIFLKLKMDKRTFQTNF